MGMVRFVRKVPHGDERERDVCVDCGFVAYQNPKVIVGSVVVAGSMVLMCRRAIEPGYGLWTLPAGYLELGETLEEGAAREAREEAGAQIRIEGILAVFSIADIGQIQVIFRAGLSDGFSPAFYPGTESLEVKLLAWNDIPWGEIAFPSVTWSLNAWRASGNRPLGQPGGNPIAVSDSGRQPQFFPNTSGPSLL